MILIDANLLIYAYDTTSPHNARARQWLEDVMADESVVVRLPWTTILAFLRITTQPRVLEQPFSPDEACARNSKLLSQPSVSMLTPGPQHWSILSSLIEEHGVRGGLITDAHLAAMAIEYDAPLCTHDRDFERFRGLRVEYPI